MAFKRLASDDVPILNPANSETKIMDGPGSETEEAPGTDFAHYSGSKNPMAQDVINKKG